MRLLDPDRYYTPADVAERVVAATGVSAMASCVDTACGGGSLLRASELMFPGVRCIGLDRDRRAILRLAREKPGWILSRADLLRLRAGDSVAALDYGVGCDFALMNPPFSMGGARGGWVVWRHQALRAGVAMGHVLRTLELFLPRCGGVAVVPESMMFSRLDEESRRLLGADYRIEIVGELRNSTFRGARANSMLVKFSNRPRRRGARDGISERTAQPRGFEIVRGGLPVFEARSCADGIPFVHSTSLKGIARAPFETLRLLPKVAPIGRGVVAGPIVLLPRVGLPTRNSLVARLLRQPVQLSDCVIALTFSTYAAAALFAGKLQQSADSLASLYRGTGARYTSVDKLTRWLSSLEMEHPAAPG
jgi:hypothetical protein